METNGQNINEQKTKGQELTVKELLNKHMEDPNHVISDDELASVKTGVEVKAEEVDAKEEEIKEQPTNDALPNPYSVLGD